MLGYWYQKIQKGSCSGFWGPGARLGAASELLEVEGHSGRRPSVSALHPRPPPPPPHTHRGRGRGMYRKWCQWVACAFARRAPKTRVVGVAPPPVWMGWHRNLPANGDVPRAGGWSSAGSLSRQGGAGSGRARAGAFGRIQCSAVVELRSLIISLLAVSQGPLLAPRS